MSDKLTPHNEVFLKQLFQPTDTTLDNEQFVKSVMKGIHAEIWMRSLLLLAAVLIGTAILIIQFISLPVPFNSIFTRQFSDFSSMQFSYILISISLCLFLPIILNSLASE